MMKTMMKPPATGIHKGKPREKKKYAIPHGNCKLLSAKPRRCLLSLSHPQADNFRADKQTPILHFQPNGILLELSICEPHGRLVTAAWRKPDYFCRLGPRCALRDTRMR